MLKFYLKEKVLYIHISEPEQVPVARILRKIEEQASTLTGIRTQPFDLWVLARPPGEDLLLHIV